MTTPLTPQQIKHYEIMGFLVLRGYAKPLMPTLQQLIGQVSLANHPITPESLLTMTRQVDFLAAASSLLGSTARITHCQGIKLDTPIPWHTDRNIGTGLRMHLFLDAMMPDECRFMIIPGSQYSPEESTYSQMLAETLQNQENPLGITPDCIPGYNLETNPGDIIITNHGIEYGIFHISRPHYALITDYTSTDKS